MFERLYSWRLKRRQRALALAWCGDPGLANWLLAESHPSITRFNLVAVYRQMADRWLQYVDSTGAPSANAQDSAPHDPDSPHDLIRCKVCRLISQMPMAQRMTLSLVDVARLSYRETAAVLDSGLFEVQYQIVTARRRLLEEMHADRDAFRCNDPVGPMKSC